MAATALQLSIGDAKLAAGGVHLPPAGLQLCDHAVERFNQIAKFVGGRNRNAVVKIAFGNLLGCLGEGGDRPGHYFRELPTKQVADKKKESGERHQDGHISQTYLPAFARQLQIATLAGGELPLGLSKTPGQGNGHKDLAARVYGCASEDVISVFPVEHLRMFSVDCPRRNPGLQYRPGCRDPEAGFYSSV